MWADPLRAHTAQKSVIFRARLGSMRRTRLGGSGSAQVDVTLTALFAGWRHIDRSEDARKRRSRDAGGYQRPQGRSAVTATATNRSVR
jgi:hypothetical protein